MVYMLCPYKTLGLEGTATQEMIKKAYRKLSFRYHPDKSGGGSARTTGKFHQVTQAYELINSPQKQSAYRGKHADPQQVPIAEREQVGKDELINMLLSGREGWTGMTRTQQAPRIQTINDEITISLRQCYDGCELPLVVNRTIEQRHLHTGTVVQSMEKETLYILLPRGIDHGEVVTVRGKGHINAEGECGDVRVRTCVTNDTVLERDGLDLVTRKELSLKEALCGFTFTIRHVSGKLCTIKNQDIIVGRGYEQRIPNLGMTRGDHTGHLIIKFDVKFPTQLSEEQKQSLREAL